MEADVQSKLYTREKNNIHLNPPTNEYPLHHRKYEKKILVGILNCTPDSFYDGGRYNSPEKAIERAEQLKLQGADIIDIGAESTRPKATPLPLKEELDRLLPVISAIKMPFSIDSYKPEVVEVAISHGACMINDVTGATNPSMRALVKSSKLPICVMHAAASYPKGVVTEIKLFFQKQIDLMVHEGIDPSQIILDPGIGFGKSVEDNLTILRHLQEFQSFGLPLYIGLSRKSFMQKVLGVTAEQTLPTTLALGTLALLKGAQFLRVHDVAEHKQVFTLLEKL